nr:hypothetical protein [Tanacetum cinerariifolium]
MSEIYKSSLTAITLDLRITDSLIREDEHLNTILEKESDEFIKSSVENLVLSPSESKDIFDGRSERKFQKFSKPLSVEEIISTKTDPHHFNAESDLIESLLNQDTLIISSLKFDYLLEEFSGELAHTDLIPPRINEANCDPEEDIHLVERLFDPFMEEIDLFLASDGSIPPGADAADAIKIALGKHANVGCPLPVLG